jgi:hypothetical protein
LDILENCATLADAICKVYDYKLIGVPEILETDLNTQLKGLYTLESIQLVPLLQEMV